MIKLMEQNLLDNQYHLFSKVTIIMTGCLVIIVYKQATLAHARRVVIHS